MGIYYKKARRWWWWWWFQSKQDGLGMSQHSSVENVSSRTLQLDWTPGWQPSSPLASSSSSLAIGIITIGIIIIVIIIITVIVINNTWTVDTHRVSTRNRVKIITTLMIIIFIILIFIGSHINIWVSLSQWCVCDPQKNTLEPPLLLYLYHSFTTTVIWGKKRRANERGFIWISLFLISGS